jgi:hypothetical protein
MAREPMEDREYEVHPSQLAWAMSNMRAAGYPPLGYQQTPAGVYVIIVQQPVGAPALDWRNVQTPHQRRESDNLRRLTLVLGALIIVASIAWAAYTVLMANGWQPPWQALPNGEPVVTQTEPSGWTLPNPLQPAQDAAQATQDAADAVTDTVAMLFRLVLVAGALFGLWLMRGLLGPLARGAADLVRGMVRR